MKLNTKLVAGFLATTGIAFGISAYAAPETGCDHMGPGMMRDGMRSQGDHTARVEQHLVRTKAQLKLTAEQEPLWQAFAEKAKAAAGQGPKATRDKAVEAKTAPEHMAVMVDAMKARTGSLEAVNAAFGKLYDALTPEQKAIADKQAASAGRMGPGRRGPPGAQDKPGARG
ncbi:MAG: Spy/CpxP family protein refolding chaperone [Rhodocyclales bacterium]|nr:Spy/CpxP family protein refolding chaperone [Rhodocyclales bacterium]